MDRLGVEYWQHANPPSEATTVECNADGEDSACSASIPSKGLNLAHTMVCVFLKQTFSQLSEEVTSISAFWLLRLFAYDG